MNGGAGLYEARALKSLRTMNGLPVPPSSYAPKEDREMRGGREGGKGGVTFDKFHFPVGKVVGDFTSGTVPEGQSVCHKVYCVKKHLVFPVHILECISSFEDGSKIR